MNLVIYYGSTKAYNMKKVLDSLSSILDNRGHKYTVIRETVYNCINCGFCVKHGECCLSDKFPKESLKECDGIIILSPIFFFSFSAKAKAFLDRLYSVKLEDKIITSITLSGSDTSSIYCGFDLIEETLIRTSEYCGSKYVQPINFVTGDKELEVLDTSIIESFVRDLEVSYEIKKED